MDAKIFREYDIRGKFPKQINEITAYKIARGFAAMLLSKNVQSCIVGHDARIYSESLKNALVDGLLKSGINVIDIGLCTTPVAYFAQYHFNVKGLAMVTASHNPNGWSGFKLGYGFSSTLLPEDIKQLQKLIAYEDFGSNSIGSYKAKNVLNEYIETLTKKVDIKKKHRIVLNCRNGTASIVAPRLLKKLKCEVIELFCNIDFSFPNGNPNPSDDSMLRETAKRVVENNADVGFALDGDADRLGVVDEKGNIVYADRVLALLAKNLLKNKMNANVVYDVKCSRLLEEVIKSNGSTPIMWKTGHSYIKQKAKELNAVLAGERSGHFFIFDNYFGYDDACFAALKLLECLNKPLSQQVDSLPKYFSSPTFQIPCKDEEKYDIVEKIKDHFSKKFEKVNSINGVRVELAEGWFLVRASSNLPAIVVVFEATTKEKLKRLEGFLRAELSKFGLSQNWKVA